MRGKGSTIVTLAITVFLVLGVLSPVCHSAREGEETTGTPAGWTNDIRLTNSSYPDVEHSISVAGNDVHLVWDHQVTEVGPGGHYDIYYKNSTNAGLDWNNPIRLTDGSPDIYYRHPDICTNGSNLHVVWDGTNSGEIHYRNSTNGGITWASSKMISLVDGEKSQAPIIAVSNSNIHVIWVDHRHKSESIPWNLEIYYARSIDGGLTWDDGLGAVGQDRRLTNALYVSGPNGIVANDSNIHMVFSDDRDNPGNFKVYYKRSVDNGATWDDGLGNIDQDREITMNSTNHGPGVIALNGSTIHIAWIDEVWPGPNYYMYYKNSTDNGASWSPIQLLVDTGTAYNPSIAVNGDEVHITWDDWRDNGTIKELYYINSVDGGVNWNPEARLTTLDGNHSAGPIISVSGNYKHITWIDERDWNLEIYYKRYPDFSPPDPEYNITLQEGWNLISLPLEQSDEAIDQVLSTIAGKWDCIQAYEPINSIWQSNITTRPDSLNDLDTLNHKMGFWINITEPGGIILTINGYDPPTTSISLYVGWNLVGYTSLNTETVANALWGTGADKVEVFDPGEPYRIREVGPSYVMKPGEGYWVHVPADSTWIIDW